MTPVLTFRGDINGLRAWAVVSVILFHFGIPGFGGGFVGVDIFFVISGFLMTGIIIRGLEKIAPDGTPSFSLIGFYLSRGRRVIPALLVLCATLLLAGWPFLPAIEYRTLASHAATALGFLSNIKLWSEAGYFDAASHEKWLLHTWSLSVEWQFYMILPVVMMLFWKITPGRRAAMLWLGSILIISLAYSVFGSSAHPSASFFLLHTRAWEMLTGGLVYLMGNKLGHAARPSRWLYFMGFALLVVSIAAFDSTTVWPAHNALLPVTGTAMVLLAARQGGFLSGHAVLQRLGDWSYSLYLWHWPLVVALAYLNRAQDPNAICAALAATLLLGWLSYRLVEAPARNGLAGIPRLASVTVTTGLVMLATLPAVAIYMKDGVPGRLAPEIEAIFAEAQNTNPRRKECHTETGEEAVECRYGGGTLGAVVIGDSHAASIISAVKHALPTPDLHVLAMTLSGCPTIEGVKGAGAPGFSCEKPVQNLFAKLDRVRPEIPVILSNRFSAVFWGSHTADKSSTSPPAYYLTAPHPSRTNDYLEEMREGYVNTLCKLAENRKVYALGPTPELTEDVPKAMGRAAQRGEDYRVKVTIEHYGKRNQFALDTLNLAREQCGITVLDPVPSLCSNDGCYGDVHGVPIYYDDDHLNERGSDVLAPLFQSVFSSGWGRNAAAVGQEAGLLR